MNIFQEMKKQGHEQIIFFQEKKAGLKAVLAIHDTTLGPGLGGCRMWPYETEEEVIQDVMLLSRGMTYKSGIAGVDFGGAKLFLWGDPEKDKNEALLRSAGKFINGLGGRFCTGTDVGTTYNDFVIMGKETPYVCALPEEYGGSGDSSIATSYGVFNGIKACVQYKYGSDQLEGKTVVLQGLGKVGLKLAGHLIEAGCRLIGSDINPENTKKAARLGVEIVEPGEIYQIKCDIFSPNALGGVINEETINLFDCNIIAGAANNVLADSVYGKVLFERGILYAPDYVINSGGLIQVADELEYEEYSRERVMKKCEAIYGQLMEIFKISEENSIPTQLAANKIVEERLKKIAAIHTIR